ncbi:MAG TPA: peptidoglycan-binding domain-containing protein [Chthoniobacterales bacterium]|jgi:hypothetical protein|nr:peptidoglycan-binding domain-containing protein [Chthoniobacterales bacterium]
MKRFVFCFLVLAFVAVCPARADDGVREVQSRLKAGGFYFGEINGRFDSETAAGVTRYQIRNGLQITGKLDGPTRYALGVSATAPPTPMPRFGEDVWRRLRKSDQATITRQMAEDARSNPAKTIAANPPAAGPPPSPPAVTKRPPARYDTDRLKGYIAAFVLAGVESQGGAETEFFANRVDYFGERGVTKEKVRRDLERYNRQWPERGFWLAGELEVKPAGERLNVSFPLRYELRNGPKRAAGRVWKTLILEKTPADDLQIVAVNERKM